MIVIIMITTTTNKNNDNNDNNNDKDVSMGEVKTWDGEARRRERFQYDVLCVVGAAPDLRERESAPKRGRHSTMISFPPKASVQWQPDGLTVHAKKWFLGAGFLGAPPIYIYIYTYVYI